MDTSGNHPIDMLIRTLLFRTQSSVPMMNRRASSLYVPFNFWMTGIGDGEGEGGILQRSMFDTGGVAMKADPEFVKTLKPPCCISGESSCSVCQDDYDISEDILELPCNHVFHRDCITQWFDRSNSCPVCRSKFQGVEYSLRPTIPTARPPTITTTATTSTSTASTTPTTTPITTDLSDTMTYPAEGSVLDMARTISSFLDHMIEVQAATRHIATSHLIHPTSNDDNFRNEIMNTINEFLVRDLTTNDLSFTPLRPRRVSIEEDTTNEQQTNEQDTNEQQQTQNTQNVEDTESSDEEDQHPSASGIRVRIIPPSMFNRQTRYNNGDGDEDEDEERMIQEAILRSLQSTN